MPENTYTPDDEDVFIAYRFMSLGLMRDPDDKPRDPAATAESDAEYRRWLAAHDAQVARNAVLRIADDFESDAKDAEESEDFDYAYEMTGHALNIRQTANLRYPEEPTDA